MRIIFTGSGEFGIPTLGALLEAGHEIFPYTQPDRPAGRGRKLTPTPIAKFAGTKNLAAIGTADFNAEKLPDANLMVVIAFGQKISPAAVGHAKLGAVNLHASLLPKYRGAAPINWAILRGESETGNSVIRLAQKMDAGAVLGQSRLAIGEIETAGELHDRLAIDGAGLVMKVIEQLRDGSAREIVQDESAATMAPKLARESARIDWNGSGTYIARKIRGLYPWPGCRVELCDAAGAAVAGMTLVRARPAECEGPRWHPGEIAIDGCVACGEEALEILEVVPDGKEGDELERFSEGEWVDAGDEA